MCERVNDCGCAWTCEWLWLCVNLWMTVAAYGHVNDCCCVLKCEWMWVCVNIYIILRLKGGKELRQCVAQRLSNSLMCVFFIHFINSCKHGHIDMLFGVSLSSYTGQKATFCCRSSSRGRRQHTLPVLMHGNETGQRRPWKDFSTINYWIDHSILSVPASTEFTS